jgi:hypothetical protein
LASVGSTYNLVVRTAEARHDFIYMSTLLSYKGHVYGIVPHMYVQPEIHRVDPESGSTLRLFIGLFSQTAGSTCEFWVNPVNFTFTCVPLPGEVRPICQPISPRRDTKPPRASARICFTRCIGAIGGRCIGAIRMVYPGTLFHRRQRGIPMRSYENRSEIRALAPAHRDCNRPTENVFKFTMVFSGHPESIVNLDMLTVHTHCPRCSLRVASAAPRDMGWHWLALVEIGWHRVTLVGIGWRRVTPGGIDWHSERSSSRTVYPRRGQGGVFLLLVISSADICRPREYNRTACPRSGCSTPRRPPPPSSPAADHAYSSNIQYL